MMHKKLLFSFILFFGICIAAVKLMAQTESQKVEHIDVLPADQRALVESIIPLQVGDVYETSLVDISKRLLLATERFEEVEVQWIASENKFRIKVNPRLTFDAVNWRGDSISGSEEIQKNCVPPNESRDLSQERISQITRCVLQGLQGRGYLDAQVQLSIEDPNLNIQVAVGDRYSIDSVEWAGATVFRTSELEDEIKNNTKAVILLDGTGTTRLNIQKDNLFETLAECVEGAFALAEKGDVILFSPAFASFSKEFNNEYEKNDAFVRILESYSKK
jgi:outer membrane protein assembly factor BamA